MATTLLKRMARTGAVAFGVGSTPPGKRYNPEYTALWCPLDLSDTAAKRCPSEHVLTPKDADVTPRVYISYTWHTPHNKERVLALADELRASGIDSHIDLYYAKSLYGFLPPETDESGRDPWNVWQEEQVVNADLVVFVCTSEYTKRVRTSTDSGAHWDVRYVNERLASGSIQRRRLVPVGFADYQDAKEYIPDFLKGSQFYDLTSAEARQDLIRRIESECGVQQLTRAQTQEQPSSPGSGAPAVRTGMFVSYSHKDKKAFKFLMEHLAVLRKQGHRVWTDEEIAPSQRWHDEITEELRRARIAILLVTPSFVASPYIASQELPSLLEAAETNGLQIFWIPWEAADTSELDRFQAAHPPDEPLTTLQHSKRQQAMVTIVKKLRAALSDQRTSTPGAAPSVKTVHLSGRTNAVMQERDIRDYEQSSAVAIRPSLVIVYRTNGWHLENKGRGLALNIIVAQKHVSGANKGQWFNPVRVSALGPGERYHMAWLGHENDTGLGASYEDEDGRPFTSVTGNDVTRVLRENAMRAFGEDEIRRDWEFFTPTEPPRAEPAVRLRVHQAYFDGETEACMFINVANVSRTDRPVEITHVWFEAGEEQIAVLQPSRRLPRRLRASASWETWLPVARIPPRYRRDAYRLFKVRLSNGDVIASEQNVDVPHAGEVPGGDEV